MISWCKIKIYVSKLLSLNLSLKETKREIMLNKESIRKHFSVCDHAFEVVLLRPHDGEDDDDDDYDDDNDDDGDNNNNNVFLLTFNR